MAEQWILSDIETFRESAPVNPHDAIADFPTGVLNRTRQPMEGSRAAERQQVRPRLGDSQGFRAPRFAPRLKRPHIAGLTLRVIGTCTLPAPLPRSASVYRIHLRIAPHRNVALFERIPFLSHKAEAVGRIADNGVDGVGGERGHDGAAISQVEFDVFEAFDAAQLESPTGP